MLLNVILDSPCPCASHCHCCLSAAAPSAPAVLRNDAWPPSACTSYVFLESAQRRGMVRGEVSPPALPCRGSHWNRRFFEPARSSAAAEPCRARTVNAPCSCMPCPWSGSWQGWKTWRRQVWQGSACLHHCCGRERGCEEGS